MQRHDTAAQRCVLCLRAARPTRLEHCAMRMYLLRGSHRSPLCYGTLFANSAHLEFQASCKSCERKWQNVLITAVRGSRLQGLKPTCRAMVRSITPTVSDRGSNRWCGLAFMACWTIAMQTPVPHKERCTTTQAQTRGGGQPHVCSDGLESTGVASSPRSRTMASSSCVMAQMCAG